MRMKVRCEQHIPDHFVLDCSHVRKMMSSFQSLYKYVKRKPNSLKKENQFKIQCWQQNQLGRLKVYRCASERKHSSLAIICTKVNSQFSFYISLDQLTIFHNYFPLNCGSSFGTHSKTSKSRGYSVTPVWYIRLAHSYTCKIHS